LYPLADDSDDEKKLFKAEAKAERKVKAEKSKKTKRTHPYVTPATDKFTTLSASLILLKILLLCLNCSSFPLRLNLCPSDSVASIFTCQKLTPTFNNKLGMKLLTLWLKVKMH
jgi:hypothetical protein